MVKRIAIINPEKCHPDECGHLCMKKCPINKMGDECMFINESNKCAVDENLCVGCGICPKICPFNAIDIINLPDELDSDPIHRYGENSFALYGLPIPLFGKVVGVLGRNGIGKSTALQILAGVIKPNFGHFNEETSYKEVIDHFKGSEAQAYFEKLSKGEIKISFKLQQVELIAKKFSGTVESLLKKANEKSEEEFNSIIETLELVNVMDRDIKQVSGGELQRIAIAASVLKKANVYCFDEPTSYLDIKQRLKISKFIRSLADENTAVLIIEHDLIVLDYISDFIHILYGKENAYGVVSTVKATKNGINTYLSGYLKEENVRFRNQEIVFDSSAQDEEVSIHPLFSWLSFDKTYGNFSLEVNEGTVFRHDVIGVLGENGIGKTSFVRELVKASKGSEDAVAEIELAETIKELEVAYKPQQIEATDEIVRVYLKDAMKYDVQLLRPLRLNDLLDQQLNQLSGGELQRVVIAKTLAENAHIYFLDEPSAYLDVEQRLILSKVIRNMMDIKKGSVLVVDHDLLFIDYLSKRLLVFEGTPAVNGVVKGPFSMSEGMFNFLEDLGITFRRDEANNRPRVNKVGSQKDKEQKASGQLYYSG